MSTPTVKVIPLFRCGSCGGQGQPVDLECADTGTVTEIVVCKKCRKRHRKALKKVRPVFKRMRKIGVPKEIITEVMCFLLDRWPDPEREASSDDS